MHWALDDDPRRLFYVNGSLFFRVLAEDEVPAFAPDEAVGFGEAPFGEAPFGE